MISSITFITCTCINISIDIKYVHALTDLNDKIRNTLTRKIVTETPQNYYKVI